MNLRKILENVNSALPILRSLRAELESMATAIKPIRQRIEKTMIQEQKDASANKALEFERTLNWFSVIEERKSVHEQVTALENIVSTDIQDPSAKLRAALDDLYQKFLLAGLEPIQGIARITRDRLVALETKRNLAIAPSGVDGAEIEKLKEVTGHFESAGLPGDLRDRFQHFLSAFKMLKVMFAGRLQPEQEKQFENLISEAEEVSSSIKAGYEVTSHGEVATDLALRVISLVTANDISKLKSKLPILLSFDPKIDSLGSLAEKCQRMISLIAEAEELIE